MSKVKEKGKDEDEMETIMEVEEVFEEEESEFETEQEIEEIFEDEEDDVDDENFTQFTNMRNAFIEETRLVYNKGEGTVMFEQNDAKITFKMPHIMEIFKQAKLMGLSTDFVPPFLEKKHTKSVYLRNEEDKRRGVEYVMSKILGFYKECLELGPKYLRGMDDEGEVTLYLMRRSLEILRKFHWMILGGRFN
ncbi:hypothetical protein Tco_0814375 [Tanacetum coccineum]